jgi:hypothetical protein
MYIENSNHREKEEVEDDDLDEETEEVEEDEYDLQDEDNFRHALIHWQAAEYVSYEKDKKWYLYISLVLIIIVAYAVFTNSPVMAITFILIGVVGYIFLNRKPKIIDFSILNDGITSGKNLYEFENIESFWIFYEPPHTRVISLHMRGTIMPFIHIHIGDADPIEIRRILMEYLPEIKQKPSAINTMERFLGI